MPTCDEWGGWMVLVMVMVVVMGWECGTLHRAACDL